MFGYVRPIKDELKLRELREYEAVYCGLCRTIGHRNGFIARFFLNYDFVFLAMLLSPLARPSMTTCHCPARLWCKKKACAQGEGLELAADEGTILSYWKLRDTVTDGTFLEKIAARLLSLLLHPAYRRAASRQPSFDCTVSSCLAELRMLELECTPSLDRAADTFARLLQAAAATSGNKIRDRALEQLLYHLGRWIYLLDAWDDLDKDRKTRSYNPVSARFPGAEEENQDYLRTTLRHSRNLVASAYGLLDSSCWGSVIDNIIYLGLPTVEDLVFSGCWGKNKRNRRQTHERSL